MLSVSAESEHPGYLTMKLFLKKSHQCEHNPPTLQTDGRRHRRTDGQTTYYCNSALYNCSTAR